MKALAFTSVIVGCILIFSFFLMENQDDTQGEKSFAVANSFLLYRNAVHKVALRSKNIGSYPLQQLNLPSGLIPVRWKNRIVLENDELRCYVYGSANMSDFLAAQRLLLGSAAIGWSEKGKVIRSGLLLPCPDFIPSNNVVSVITLD